METKRRRRDKPYVQFDMSMLPKIYELAKSGLNDTAISNSLGLNKHTITTWISRRPYVRVLVEEGRKYYQQEMSQGVSDFVYDRLSPEAKKVWEKLVEFNQKDDVPSINHIVTSATKRIRQQIFYYALIKFDFNASDACRFMNMSLKTYESWISSDQDFALLLREIHQNKKDFYESALIRLVRSGDTSAILFVNKTFNRDRGYGDKVDVNFTGALEHKHSFEDLDLPIEVRRQVLEAVRKKQALQLEDHSNVVEAEFTEKNLAG